MNDYLALALGVVCAGLGGELFVRGAVGLAHWARISPGIIGATVAAFATSSPELSVSINAAMAGQPQIALGDALGSNVVNVALILALALAISGIQSPRSSVKRDFPVALLIPVVTGLLFLDGELSRLDGFLMLGMFLVWLAATAIEARKQRSAAERVLGERRGWLVAFYGSESSLRALRYAIRLATADGLLKSAAVPYTKEILVGHIAEAIARRADELGCDNIVMGTRGMTAISNLVMGSVATKVVHLAKPPVTLVK